jgi:isoquinoline 1-oxidoreductase subunit alpha
MKLIVNARAREVPEDVADGPLLWVLREQLGLPGTRFGCGVGVCGACTVHVAGRAARSCTTTARAVGTAEVTTIEGLGRGERLHPVQEAWLAEAVPQCGYCQSGQIMAAAALLAEHPHPSRADVAAAMAGNLCRCGTYERIWRAFERLAGPLR